MSLESDLKKYYEDLSSEMGRDPFALTRNIFVGPSCNCPVPIPGEGFGKFEPSIYPYYGCVLVDENSSPAIIWEPPPTWRERLRQWWRIFTLRGIE